MPAPCERDGRRGCPSCSPRTERSLTRAPLRRLGRHRRTGDHGGRLHPRWSRQRRPDRHRRGRRGRRVRREQARPRPSRAGPDDYRAGGAAVVRDRARPLPAGERPRRRAQWRDRARHGAVRRPGADRDGGLAVPVDCGQLDRALHPRRRHGPGARHRRHVHRAGERAGSGRRRRLRHEDREQGRAGTSGGGLDRLRRGRRLPARRLDVRPGHHRLRRLGAGRGLRAGQPQRPPHPRRPSHPRPRGMRRCAGQTGWKRCAFPAQRRIRGRKGGAGHRRTAQRSRLRSRARPSR